MSRRGRWREASERGRRPPPIPESRPAESGGPSCATAVMVSSRQNLASDPCRVPAGVTRGVRRWDRAPTSMCHRPFRVHRRAPPDLAPAGQYFVPIMRCPSPRPGGRCDACTLTAGVPRAVRTGWGHHLHLADASPRGDNLAVKFLVHSLHRCEGAGAAVGSTRVQGTRQGPIKVCSPLLVRSETGSRKSWLRRGGLKRSGEGNSGLLLAHDMVLRGLRPRRPVSIDDVRPLRLRVPESLRASPSADDRRDLLIKSTQRSSR